ASQRSERAEEGPDRLGRKGRPVVAILMHAPAHRQPLVAARVIDALRRCARGHADGVAAVAPEPTVAAHLTGGEWNRHVVLAVSEPDRHFASATRAVEG